MNRRTDIGRIQYPRGLTVSDRRFCRRLIVAASQWFSWIDLLIISCSGGIDSTVLTHAIGQGLLIQPNNRHGKKIEATAVYLNHHLRPDEVERESGHVTDLSDRYLTFRTPALSLNVADGPGLQARARTARYDALTALCQKHMQGQSDSFSPVVVTAHNANDVAETKLYQFIKGKEVSGIPNYRTLDTNPINFVHRPLLRFSRKDIERYARCFNLSWCEDSSNRKEIYTRNLIRHKLMPLIEQINPGFINTHLNP